MKINVYYHNSVRLCGCLLFIFPQQHPSALNAQTALRFHTFSSFFPATTCPLAALFLPFMRSHDVASAAARLGSPNHSLVQPACSP